VTAGCNGKVCLMQSSVVEPRTAPRGLLSRILAGLFAALKFVVILLIIVWATLAIYYSNLPWPMARLVLAVAFAAFSAWAFWLSGRRLMSGVALVLFFGVVAWWISIQPTGDRDWRPEVAVMPRAIINGDNVRITGVRNFEYRSRDDFTPRYETRDYQLSHLKGVDFYVSYWSDGFIGRFVGHTFLSFTFDNAPPLSISIETRPEVGRGFEPVASAFKQFELIYVVGDEKDLVGSRVMHRGEFVYLYRLNASLADARKLLMVYLKRINELADHPEFYNLFSNSCTVNIIRYANAAGRKGPFAIGHLLNGLIDSYLYHSGRIYTDLPFYQLRQQSRVNDAVRAAYGQPDFSERIRANLPTDRK